MENLGEKIKEQRILKKMTIEELSKETFLSVAILKDIEAGKFDRYEGEETYVKMYLKKISDVLDLDKQELTQSYVELTKEIKLSQLDEKLSSEKNQEKIVKEGKNFKFGSPHLARKKSVYEDKSHIKIFRFLLVFILIAGIITVLWWGISKTKSNVDSKDFNKNNNIAGEGQILPPDDKDDKNKVDNNQPSQPNNNPSVSKVKFEKKDSLKYDFTIDSEEKEFVFKIVFGNDSWSSLKVNDQNYSEFDAKVYKKDESVELKFNSDDFNSLDLKNGYSMGHRYFINNVEVPLSEDDYSEGITHLILQLKK
jgi:hypothetical protein